MINRLKVILLWAVLFMTGCQKNSPVIFQELPADRTGIHFINSLEEGPGNNILESEFYYNGGGIAVGDINNDGLPDIYFTANQGENALYLNLGDYRFKNITMQAGVSDSSGWTAGVAMADVNGDGLLDIYVCKAGNIDKEDRKNKLFINQGADQEGIPVFTEQSAVYGLDDDGYCTQPVFFDYDRDGFLDLFIVNYSVKSFSRFNIRTIREETDPHAGDKLYRNNGDGTFSDVSRQAGIQQNPIAFGLSATVSDLNGDGWPDIYVTNDYIERDYMYINQRDGTFKDEILSRTDLIPYFSMGSDIADINNDGFPDILVVDMLPPDYSRRSVFKSPDYGMYEELAANGYHRQNMRNMLQLNSGSGVFTEIGQLSGISRTDWSWSALIADFDNDGHKDIFVTNGFPRFYTNLDYLNSILWAQFPDEDLPDDPVLKYDLVQQMEKVEMQNFAFRNGGNLLFEDVTEAWGLNRNSVSSGAAYADLNNSGSLDLIVSNLNEPPFVFKNIAREHNGNHYLKIRLKGSGENSYGTGSKVTLKAEDGTVFFQEAFQSRGFQSTVDPVLHFGLGKNNKVDVEVVWPDQSKTLLEEVTANQTVTIEQKDAQPQQPQPEDSESGLFWLMNERALGIDFVHQASFFRDRVFSPLLPHTLNNLGPAMAVSDINGDGLEDFFIGGGQDQPAGLFLQQPDGTFAEMVVPVFQEHRIYEDVDAVFFDADGDGHPDLYVVSGGNFDPLNGPLYQDRLYLNDGFGNFTYAPDALPEMHSSGGTVTVLDVDGDGIPDLFVGGRVLTGRYPSPPRSYLLHNKNGIFSDITAMAAPELLNPGLITDAVWADVDNDGENELILAGEWMPIRIFKPDGDKESPAFREVTIESGLKNSSGWWNVLKVADLNGDGTLDLIAGNRGTNASFHATPEDPVILYLGDFDNNGFLDPVITYQIEGDRYPLPDRDLFLKQLPRFREKYPDYASWSNASIDEILGRRELRDAEKFYAHTFESAIFINDGTGVFKMQPLPAEAQVAPIHDIVVADFFPDTLPGILAVGNNFGNRPEMGPAAGHGVLLRTGDNLELTALPLKESGFHAPGDNRKVEWISTSFGPLFLLGRYGDSVRTFLYNPSFESINITP